MASGGFHGGSTHSGGFHSSGGGGGSSRSSGGSSGGSYSSGSYGSDSYSSGDYSSDGDFGIVELCIFLIMLFGGATYFFFSLIGGGEILGLLIIISPFLIVCGVLLFFGLRESDRTSSINTLLKNGPSRTPGRVWSKKQKHKDKTDGKSFYGARKTYDINLNDPDFGDANSQKVYDMVIMTPGIIWIKPSKLLFGAIISFLSNLFFYELVIPIFENLTMTDQAFRFIDILVLLFPSIACLTFSAYSLIVVKIKDNLLYKCAVRIVEDNNAIKNRLKTEDQIACILSKAWYYNNCPNCGTKATEREKVCSRCGSSLEADFKNGGRPSSCHRVLEYSKKKKSVSGGEVKEKTDT